MTGPVQTEAGEAAVFMISLADADGRRALMREQHLAAGISPQIVDAVDSRVIPRETFLESCTSEGPWGYFHTKDMACNLSHARVWDAFLKTEAPIALILEDDIFLSPEIGRWLADLSWWPEGADIVRAERWRSDSLRVIMGHAEVNRHGRDIRRMHSRHPGGAAYFITRDAARLALDARPFSVTLDQFLFNPAASPLARRLRTYQVCPAMAEQGNEPPNTWPEGPIRHRPTGKTLLRQKVRRALHEVRLPLPFIAGLATGRVRALRVDYKAASEETR